MVGVWGPPGGSGIGVGKKYFAYPSGPVSGVSGTFGHLGIPGNRTGWACLGVRSGPGVADTSDRTGGLTRVPGLGQITW